ncbi:MAG TPA: hypothetical protein VFD32_14900, partial [Dehalococcoidia bacterium]|nr:hypothetical protein [Dehalococcoidia bacterium]
MDDGAPAAGERVLRALRWRPIGAVVAERHRWRGWPQRDAEQGERGMSCMGVGMALQPNRAVRPTKPVSVVRLEGVACQLVRPFGARQRPGAIQPARDHQATCC